MKLMKLSMINVLKKKLSANNVKELVIWNINVFISILVGIKTRKTIQ